MSNLITISGVRGFIDENGTAQLHLADVARGLGFTETRQSGVEYIRWGRVNEYLADLNFSTSGEDFIPENIFYRLAMKAKNETAEKFQTVVADEILPAIRKTGTYSAPQMTQTQIIAAIAQAAAEQEQQLKQIAATQTKQAEELQGMRDVISLDTTSWREDTKKLLNKIANKIGDITQIRELRSESYKLLDSRMGVSLQTRLTNKRRRMADEGICKSSRDKLNVIDVIAEDKKLIEGYTSIIKEMTIKYGC
jgi:prophage antirepressor-like protein